MKKLAIGVDIGGINTAFGLVDENGDLYAESVISTKKYPYVDDYPAYVEDLCQAMHALADSLSFEYELTGIGIGAPNANFHKGTVENPANLWKFREGDPNPDESRRLFPLADDIGRCFGGVKVLVTNDANAATIGEMIYGNAKGMRDFVMITLGTGLGSGFVSNGEMIYGHDGFAGEFGHIIVERNGRECGCGRRGCLETYVSATGIKRTAFELMATMTAPSKLRDIAFADFDASMISAAAEQGDPVALEAFRYTGELLGRALADVVTVTSPEAIFLFGGLSKAGKLIFEPTQWYMEENMLFVFKNKVKLLPSGIQGKNAAILGASALMQGLADGYFVLPYTIGDYLSHKIQAPKVKTDTKAFDEAEKGVREKIAKLLSIGGKQSVDDIHKKLGHIMWENVGMARSKESLEKAISEIQALRKEFWKDVKVVGQEKDFNVELEKALRLADFLELGELMARDALNREESCGGHFRVEHQTEEGEAKRDDENFVYAAVWEYKGEDAAPELTKEPLNFEFVHPAQRNYKD